MIKVSLLTSKSETCFESFIMKIRQWEMNTFQNAHQTLIQML